MGYSWKTFGHGNAKRLLEFQLEAGRPFQAYLFSGPDGIGKRTLAEEFCSKLLQTTDPRNHPDFRLIDGSQSVEDVRRFSASLYLRPMTAKYLVALILHADRLNSQAANALLKTLEEPASQTVIILLGEARMVLPTIRSRCFVLHLNLFSQSELAEFAEQAGMKAAPADLKFSLGSPARLSRLIAGNSQASLSDRLPEWEDLSSRSPADRMLAVAELSELDQEILRDLTLEWMGHERERLTVEPGRASVLRALLQAWVALLGTQNKKSVLQELMMKI